MCGIGGVVSRSSSARWLPNVEAMSGRMIHRGPDSAGIHDGDETLLAVRRLAIIDVGGGSQPLFNEDGRLALVANCEIYNHVELAARLQDRGHRFGSRSDAEVILHLYEEFGIDCVHHLRGMFAFALWDSRAKRLLLVRDRMGEKPLYIAGRGDSIFFASEMKALLASGEVPFQLDPAAVRSYLHYGYVPEPATAVRGVRKIPAGCLMTVDVPEWRIAEAQYWQLDAAPSLRGDPPKAIRAALEETAAIITRADVPVGLALSGGLDSSAVAALLAPSCKANLRCYSVGYPDRPPFDESGSAEDLARRLGYSFSRVELKTRDVAESFPDLTCRMDDPIADIAAPSYAAIGRAARDDGAKALIFGHGGDELFWGYPWVVDAVRQAERKRQLLRGEATLFRYLRPRAPDRFSRASLSEWVRGGAGLRTGWSAWRRDRRAPAEFAPFYELTPGFQAGRRHLRSGDEDLFHVNLDAESLDVEVTRLICASYLVENGIALTDRLLMSYSVEPRMPLLDYRLVETVIGLRKAGGDHDLSPKAWLKDAVRDLLPPAILTRAKRGFQPPAPEWLTEIFRQHGRLLDGGVLENSGIFEAPALRSFLNPSKRERKLAYAVLVLESWARQMEKVT